MEFSEVLGKIVPAARGNAREPKEGPSDPDRIVVATWLGGRSVRATLDPDGMLDVLLGPRLRKEHGSDAPVEFKTKASTARQAAVALTIVLTRLRAAGRDPDGSGPRRSPDMSWPRPAVTHRGRLDEGLWSSDYVHRRGAPTEAGPERYESPDGSTVAVLRGMPDAGGASRGPGWFESVPILDGKLRVRIGEVRELSVDFAPAEGRSEGESHPVLVSSAATPQTVVVAILAALSHCN